MGLVPTNKAESRIAGRLTQELREVIQAHMPDKFKGIQENRQLNAAKNVASTWLRDEDVEEIIIGLALKLTSKEILTIVSEKRQKDGLPPVESNNLTYYRTKYSEIIDEVYTLAALRIGEIYSNADKIVRIARYNELADALRTRVMEDIEGEIDDLSIKKMNTYLRVLDRVNIEMGNIPMSKMIRRQQKEPDESGTPDDGIGLSKEETIDLIKKALNEKYKNQLPDAISEKLSFTDYTNCANGEQLSGVTVCWNDKMTDNDAGTQCPVQAGKVKKCPKFLNQSLLNNKDWLLNARKQGLSVAKIISLVGCDEWDVDVRNRVAWFLKKHDIIKVIPRRPPAGREEKIEDLETSDEENVVEVD
jgi:predicted house-cleaning noncanonical NTP pyrophosphatase (MazG superfamily)